MKIKLPKYTRNDYLVLAVVILPFTIGINTAIFGKDYFRSVPFFLLSSLVTIVSYFVFFVLCGFVAVFMQRRFPMESQVPRRLSIMIISFLIMSGLFLSVLFRLFVSIKYFEYHFDENSFVWAYFGIGIINIFLTLLFEGISRFERWKAEQRETDELKKTYQHSRLRGLKSQVNPHFLFNSLNSLSSLISENEEEAEHFLDEMSKVYRYMLRTDDEDLVTLETELKFLSSYAYLLKARYGSGLQLQVDIQDSAKEKYLPTLTLQLIVENAFTQNSIQKNSPLFLKITTENNCLIISNNIQPKLLRDDFDTEVGLDNLVAKFQLLSERALHIADNRGLRTITIPLLNQNKEVVI